MSSAAALAWFARHEIRLAWREWLAMMTGGRRKRTRAVIGLIVFAARHASAGLCRDRPLRRSARAARQILADRHHRDHPAGLGVDAVAGDRIGDAGILRARRSRPDHVVAGPAGKRLLGPHRRDRAVGDRDGAVVVDALRRCPRDRRRHPLACGLRRRRRHRPVGRGGRDRGHGRAVSADRPEPDAAGGADSRRHHRRRLRHRAADRRDPVLRHAVALRGADAPTPQPRSRPTLDSVVWWPARAALGDGEALLLLLGGGLVAARRRDGDLLAAVCRHRGRRLGQSRRPDRQAARARRVPRRLAAAGAAAQGIRAAAPRSLAGVADPDAAAVSGAAGADAVAQLFRHAAWPSC